MPFHPGLGERARPRFGAGITDYPAASGMGDEDASINCPNPLLVEVNILSDTKNESIPDASDRSQFLTREPIASKGVWHARRDRRGAERWTGRSVIPTPICAPPPPRRHIEIPPDRSSASDDQRAPNSGADVSWPIRDSRRRPGTPWSRPGQRWRRCGGRHVNLARGKAGRG